MSCVTLIVVFACCSVHFVSAFSTAKIGAFNIKSFGDTKMNNPTIADDIKKIVNKYDLILIQEVRDKDESSIIKLKNLLNSDFNNDVFIFTSSEPLGRSQYYKEQYVYMFRKDRVQLLDTYQFNDTNYNDVFEREPFSILVRLFNKATTHDLVLVGLHAKPDDAVAEIKALDHVILAVLARWQNENLVVLGDLNAACNYAKESELNTTSVFRDFTPLINHDADTTVKATTTCAYDRINVHGRQLTNRIVKADVDDFEKNLLLTNDEALDVSDHFPVYFTFSMEPRRQTTRHRLRK